MDETLLKESDRSASSEFVADVPLKNNIDLSGIMTDAFAKQNISKESNSRNGHGSVQHVKKKTGNGSLENTVKLGTQSKETLVDKEVDKSVIHVEEDDDDVMELTNLDSPVINVPQEYMFSHLQNKIERNIDESIIPVEDEDDDLLEISNSEMPRNGMFSHLQDKTNAIKKLHMGAEKEELVSEDASLSFPQDESNLFQYPFIEVGRRLWPSTVDKQFYTKGCFWSPDGTCLLVPVHLDGMHIVELPTDLYTLQELPEDRGLSNLVSAVHVNEGGTVYDCCWYPYMNSSDPVSCCWLATRQHEPIHMWDAFSGELRCSYRGYDDVDEVESAISIIFSNDGQKVIAGYKKTIKIFDTNLPGRSCSCVNVKKAVSCFALTTDNDNCVTAGTWAGYINHYDLRAPKLGPLFTLGGHSGGITLLKYSPSVDHNWYLFSGARKDNKILQWDMRNYKEPIQVFERNVQTNQRIHYDITPLNMWLASGDTEGLLKIWNLADTDQQFELPLHHDCCNGVSLHPTLPVITTTSGQYHFVDLTEAEDKCGEKIVTYENSLLMLWYGPSKAK